MEATNDLTEEFFKNLLGVGFVNFNVTQNNQSVLVVQKDFIVRALTLLADHKRCCYQQLVDLTVVDYPKNDPRFEVVYHLLSYTRNMRLFIKVYTDLHVASVTGVFLNANWYEREAWDMFGVVFSDHPDQRRLLTDENFEGHPLRKDFPLSGFTEVRYDPISEKVETEPLKLDQSYRSFDTLSPWEGCFKRDNSSSQSKT